MTETMKKQTSNQKTYTGGCHCGRVRYEVPLDLTKPVGRCNCSICTMVAQTSSMTTPGSLRLLKGADALGEYRAREGSPNWRRFCRHCGIHLFGGGYVEEIGGEFLSINVNTVDGVDTSLLTIEHLDGRNDNWMAGPRTTPWPIRLAENGDRLLFRREASSHQ